VGWTPKAKRTARPRASPSRNNGSAVKTQGKGLASARPFPLLGVAVAAGGRILATRGRAAGCRASGQVWSRRG
jgi:hypothetical protein